jgi:hypothetical protein
LEKIKQFFLFPPARPALALGAPAIAEFGYKNAKHIVSGK